ncbi:hypothetical protein CKA38_10255 [Ereboglobus luteus]|uniref:Sialidase domain-containing protein n=2 Tax=Ereboglobus luteus TaxID=1796921 RepID=A0A2U8E3V0_9BACT|nr:hypothetical protein CKA38_10255 [Ereboglobus luteus]
MSTATAQFPLRDLNLKQHPLHPMSTPRSFLNHKLSAIAAAAICAVFSAGALTAGGAPDFARQAALDAARDEVVVAYDGILPNRHVGDVVTRVMPDGRLAIWFATGGDKEPDPNNFMAVIYSEDEGKTWSPMQMLDANIKRAGINIGQLPTEAIVSGQKIMLFFSTHAGHLRNSWRSWVATSDNNGKTWNTPELLPGRLGAATFVRSHIWTQSGNLVVPYQHYLGNLNDHNSEVVRRNNKAGNETTPYPTPVINSRNGVLISTDGGRTFTEHGDIKLPIPDDTYLWAENTIAELEKDHLVMLIRPERTRGKATFLYRADSFDGGKTWPALAEKTDIPNPSSKTILLRVNDWTTALLHNPNPYSRWPLSLWISFDGMKTWPYQRVVIADSVDGPGRNVHYPEGYVTPDLQWINFTFDDNRHQAVYVRAKLPPIPGKPVSGKNPENPWLKKPPPKKKPAAK